jgi:hypothetical protein
MNRFVPLLLLAALVTSGCSGGGGGGTETGGARGPPTLNGSNPGITSSTSTDTTNGTTTSGGPSGNLAPTAGMVATPTSGSAPLNVSFALTGSDPEGDDLSWTLDTNGDGAADRTGTQLPETVTQIYVVAGTYNASFTLSDGRHAVVRTANVTVTPGNGGGPGGPAHFSFTGGYTTGEPTGACTASNGAPPGPIRNTGNGTTYTESNLPAGVGGQQFNASYTSATQLVNLYAVFSKAGTALGSASAGPTPAVTTLTGTIPAGSDKVYVSSCGGAQVSVTFSTP